MNGRDFDELAALIAHYRGELAAQRPVIELADVAGALLGALAEAWPNLTAMQRQTIAAAVAAVEVHAGSNRAYELAQEALDRGLVQAHALLSRARKVH